MLTHRSAAGIRLQLHFPFAVKGLFQASSQAFVPTTPIKLLVKVIHKLNLGNPITSLSYSYSVSQKQLKQWSTPPSWITSLGFQDTNQQLLNITACQGLVLSLLPMPATLSLRYLTQSQGWQCHPHSDPERMDLSSESQTHGLIGLLIISTWQFTRPLNLPRPKLDLLFLQNIMNLILCYLPFWFLPPRSKSPLCLAHGKGLLTEFPDSTLVPQQSSLQITQIIIIYLFWISSNHVTPLT